MPLPPNDKLRTGAEPKKKRLCAATSPRFALWREVKSDAAKRSCVPRQARDEGKLNMAQAFDAVPHPSSSRACRGTHIWICSDGIGARTTRKFRGQQHTRL